MSEGGEGVKSAAKKTRLPDQDPEAVRKSLGNLSSNSDRKTHTPSHVSVDRTQASYEGTDTLPPFVPKGGSYGSKMSAEVDKEYEQNLEEQLKKGK